MLYCARWKSGMNFDNTNEEAHSSMRWLLWCQIQLQPEHLHTMRSLLKKLLSVRHRNKDLSYWFESLAHGNGRFFSQIIVQWPFQVGTMVFRLCKYNGDRHNVRSFFSQLGKFLDQDHHGKKQFSRIYDVDQDSPGQVLCEGNEQL